MNDIIQQLVLTVMLVSMMFAMGLRLTIADLVAVLRDKRLVGLTFVVNFVFLPALAVLLVRWTKMDGDVAAGFLLCAAAPGATMTTLLSRNANANVPVAVALLLMLVVTSALLTPPLAAYLFASAGIAVTEMRAGMAVLSLLAIQVLPLAAGMLVRAKAPEKAEKLEPLAARFSTIVLVIVIVAMTVLNTSLVREIGGASTLVIGGFVFASTCVGGLFPGDGPTKAAAAFASGAQNIALATLLAERYLNKQALITVLIFGMITYIVLLPLVAVLRRRLPAS